MRHIAPFFVPRREKVSSVFGISFMTVGFNKQPITPMCGSYALHLFHRLLRSREHPTLEIRQETESLGKLEAEDGFIEEVRQRIHL